jgi:hypothetical protein
LLTCSCPRGSPSSRLQLTATSNKAIRYRPNSAANLLTNGQTYTASCYVKSNSGATETIRLMFGDTPTRSSDLTVTVAEGWKRVSYTFTAGATCTYVGISNGSVAGAVDVLIWGFTVHAGSSDLGYTNAQGDLLFPGAGTSPTWSAGRGLTFSGATQWLMAPLGKAVTLNGVTIYVVCRQSSSLTENQRAYGAILSTPGANFGSQTLALGGGLLASSNYRHGPALSYGTTNAGATVNASATEGVLTGTDHCICATHDGTTLRILIDGHLLAEFANLKAAQTITRLLSGFVQGAAAGGYLKGDILYMAVYASGHTVAQCRTGMTGFLSLCANRTGYSAPPTSKIVIYEGDSLTLGAGVNPVIPWTRRCTEAALEPVGVQGRSFAVLGAHIGPYPENAADHNTIRDRIATDLSTMQTAAVTKTIVAWLGGTNDATDTTTGTAISNSQALGDTVRAAGAVAIPMTMPPKLNTATPNAFRATLNAAIKDAANLGVHWDAVIDTTGDAVLGPDATATKTAGPSFGASPRPASSAASRPTASSGSGHNRGRGRRPRHPGQDPVHDRGRGRLLLRLLPLPRSAERGHPVGPRRPGRQRRHDRQPRRPHGRLLRGPDHGPGRGRQRQGGQGDAGEHHRRPLHGRVQRAGYHAGREHRHADEAAPAGREVTVSVTLPAGCTRTRIERRLSADGVAVRIDDDADSLTGIMEDAWVEVQEYLSNLYSDAQIGTNEWVLKQWTRSPSWSCASGGATRPRRRLPGSTTRRSRSWSGPGGRLPRPGGRHPQGPGPDPLQPAGPAPAPPAHRHDAAQQHRDGQRLPAEDRPERLRAEPLRVSHTLDQPAHRPLGLARW